MSEKESRDCWLDCGQIFFHYGKRYGLTVLLRGGVSYFILVAGDREVDYVE